MKQNQRGLGICLLAGCAIALLFVLIIFTPANIDPGNTDWVIHGGGDNLQHYLGWRFFRNSAWSMHVLFMRDLNYPVGTSVIVMDANPLFCLIFKVFTDVLPDSFQFNGIWILCSFLLLAVFAVLISWQLTGSIPLTIAASVLALLNPVVIQRALIHDTLTAHWLILAAILLAINADKKWSLPGWFLLGGLTLLIHVYFIPMILFVLCLQMIRMICGKRSALRIIATAAAFAAAVLLGYYGLGYNYILPQSGSYGELSLNLNAFINPDGASSILSSRPTLPLQYEGFNYLGLGMMVLAIVGIVLGKAQGIRKFVAYMIPAGLLILLAASHEGYFDLHPVYAVQLPDRLYALLSIFRSSGRLVWPLYYLLLFASLYLIARHGKRNRWAAAIVIGCVCLQGFDLKDYYLTAAERFRNPSNTILELSSEFTDLIPEDVAHLYITAGNAKAMDALALFAADRQMTFNRSANARGIVPIFGGDALELAELTCERLDPLSVYVYLSSSFPDALRKCPDAVIAETDGWKVVLSVK